MTITLLAPHCAFRAIPLTSALPQPLEGVALCIPMTSDPSILVGVQLPSLASLTSLSQACLTFSPPPLTPENSFESSFETLSHLLSRSIAHLETCSDKIPKAHRQRYQSQLKDIYDRRSHWLSLLPELGLATTEDVQEFATDIHFGLERLLQRMTRLAAEILNEPLTYRPRKGLKDRPTSERLLPHDKPHEDFVKKDPEIIPALENQDVGYGSLTLRDHQIEALNAIKGHLRLVQSQELSSHLLSGTVVMPAGGGKTRTMVAAMAAAIELKSFTLGDKIIVINHTDQIHQQNKEVVQLLGPYIQKNLGRDLKVSEYKADQKDVSGDVIVVSLPTVNTPEARTRLQEELKQSLSSQKIPLVLVDEVHHVELGAGKSKETWKELLATLRAVSPKLYQLGFTATPTGKEGSRVFTCSHHELMQKGVTPRTYYVSIEGVSLDQLKSATQGDDFQTKKLSSELNRHPERNQRIFSALDQRALRSDRRSPSGKLKLEPTLLFGADLAHTSMMAQGYAQYFQKSSSDIGQRNLRVLGQDKGKITPQELQQALNDYRSGKIDGLVTVVSGNTQVREAILKAVTAGEIECVTSVSALVEGADLWMFSHQVGARPTLSRFLKGQERYRVNRRGPDEVSPEGEILKDRPKIIFDVIDLFHGEKPLMLYRNFLGVGVRSGFGELFDTLKGEVSAQVDRSVVKPKDTIPPPKPKPPREEAEAQWEPLIQALEEIIASRYGGDVSELALDLGEDVGFVEGLLESRGWENKRWFLKRLATLMYQDRLCLTRIYNEARGLGSEKVTEADYVLLEGVITFLGKKGVRLETLRETEGITSRGLSSLSQRTLGEVARRGLYAGLRRCLEGQPETEEREDQIKKMEAHVFRSQGWTLSPQTPQDQLLFLARQQVARLFGGELPQNPKIEGIGVQYAHASLTRWIRGERVDYSTKLTPQSLYTQIEALLLYPGGRKNDALQKVIEEAIFHERGWDRAPQTPQEQLLFLARQQVARLFGGELPHEPKIERVGAQQAHSPLTRWIRGERVDYSGPLTPHSLYTQIEALILHPGEMKGEVVQKVIEEAIFHERGWDRTPQTPQEQLLFLARQQVARLFGGELPQNHRIEGISMQYSHSILTRWIRGERIEYSRGLTPHFLYPQIEALLLHPGGRKNDALQKVIEEAIFHERGWDRAPQTPQEQLLFLARQQVARLFGGELPHEPKIERVGAQLAHSALMRWIRGERVDYSSKLTPHSLYTQIEALLLHPGKMKEEVVQNVIEEAIFHERGWSRTPQDPQDQLLFLARQQVARLFGGELPKTPKIEGISVQQAHSALTRWIRGEPMKIGNVLRPQILALLTHENFIRWGEVEKLVPVG